MGITIANDLIFKQVETIDAFDITTGDYLFSLEELSDYSISHIEESQNIIGRNGRVISRIKRNKEVTISGTNGVVSAGLMSVQTGGVFRHGQNEIMWFEYLTVESDKAVISFDAVGVVGAEINSVIVKGRSGNPLASLIQGSSASDGVFEYNPANRTLSFYGIDDGTDITVYYKRRVRTTTMINGSNKYSGKAVLYVNGLAEDKCSNLYRVQFCFPRVDFSGEFALDFGQGQTVHKFEATALAGLCGGDSRYYTYDIFGVDDDEPAPEPTPPSPGSDEYMYIGTNGSYYVGTNGKVYISTAQ